MTCWWASVVLRSRVDYDEPPLAARRIDAIDGADMTIAR
jgi:hypothetical protein